MKVSLFLWVDRGFNTYASRINFSFISPDMSLCERIQTDTVKTGCSDMLRLLAQIAVSPKLNVCGIVYRILDCRINPMSE